MAVDNFLDFYDLIVNELVGDAILFVVLVLIGVSILLVRSRAPTQVFLLVMFVVAGMLSVQFPVIRWFLVLFGMGFAGWIIFARLRRE